MNWRSLLLHLRRFKESDTGGEELKGLVAWDDRQILPSTRWDAEIRARLNTADIILLLISDDYLETPYCKEVEIPIALKRYKMREARVIPVILRPCAWQSTDLAQISQTYVCPRNAKPLVEWMPPSKAYFDVVATVFAVAKCIQEDRQQGKDDNPPSFQEGYHQDIYKQMVRLKFGLD